MTSTLMPMFVEMVLNGNQSNMTLTPTVDPWPYKPIDPKQGVVLFCIFLIGIVMNLVGLIVSFRICKKHRSRGNDMIIALGIADLALIFFGSVPTFVVYLNNRWVGGTAVCDFQGFVSCTGTLITGGLTVVLAADRMIAVTKPIFYRNLVKSGRHWILVFIVIFVSLVLGIVPLIGAGRYERTISGTFCVIDWFAVSTGDVIYVSLFCALGFLMVFITIYCNIRVYIATRHMIKTRRSTLNIQKSSRDGKASKYGKDHEKEKFKTERNLALTVSVMSVVFLVCWFPYSIRIICNLANWLRNANTDINVGRLMILNSVINPFIYTFLRKKAKEEIKSWFVQLREKVSSHSDSQSGNTTEL